jgi:glycosyltransferase involved in cell wall biosynthesis
MKILVTVDPEIPVPPKLYGGVERIVEGLMSHYSNTGNEVYLLANPGSTSKFAHKIIGWKRLRSRGGINILLNSIQLFFVYIKYKPQVIHCFSRLLYLYPLFFFTRVKIVVSYGRLISPVSTGFARALSFKKITFTACAQHMTSHLKYESEWPIIHNFTDTDFFRPAEHPTLDYFVFLGRIEDIKGTSEAIHASLQLNTKIIIAGNVPPEHKDYFDKQIAPFLTNSLVEYIGPVDDFQKLKLLQNAKAMLFPIKWEEPFGVVMAEAMACGTPVVAFKRGSVDEVIIDGYNGFVVNTLPEMTAALKRLDVISRENVRKDTVRRFSLKFIGGKYLSLFHKLSGE